MSVLPAKGWPGQRQRVGYTGIALKEVAVTAKIFKSGNSQAVRLPKEFRFPAGIEEVAVRRQGERLILEPIRHEDWPEDFWQAFGKMSEDFERPQQRGQQRESWD